MKKQLAVDWLKEKLFQEFGFSYSDNIQEEAIAMEKFEILQSYREGRSDQEKKSNYYAGVPDRYWYKTSVDGNDR